MGSTRFENLYYFLDFPFGLARVYCTANGRPQGVHRLLRNCNRGPQLKKVENCCSSTTQRSRGT